MPILDVSETRRQRDGDDFRQTYRDADRYGHLREDSTRDRHAYREDSRYTDVGSMRDIYGYRPQPSPHMVHPQYSSHGPSNPGVPPHLPKPVGYPSAMPKAVSPSGYPEFAAGQAGTARGGAPMDALAAGARSVHIDEHALGGDATRSGGAPAKRGGGEGVKLRTTLAAQDIPDDEIHFAVEDSGRRFVVLMIHRCGRGPGLLPKWDPVQQQTVWVQPEDPRITLAQYMGEFLLYFTGDSWSSCVREDVGGRPLPRYQCTIPADTWRRCWDALRMPFAEQCSAYRRVLGGKGVPHLRFGVVPRLMDEEFNLAGDFTEPAAPSYNGISLERLDARQTPAQAPTLNRKSPDRGKGAPEPRRINGKGVDPYSWPAGSLFGNSAESTASSSLFGNSGEMFDFGDEYTPWQATTNRARPERHLG